MRVQIVLSLAATLIAFAPPDDRVKRLESGEIIITAHRDKRTGVTKLKAVGLMKAPPAKLWAIVDKCGGYKRTMLRIRSAKEVWRRGNKVKCAVVLAMPFPLQDITTITVALGVPPGDPPTPDETP